MSTTIASTLNLKARDITGANTYELRNFRPDLTVGELVSGLVERMGLRRADAAGTPHAWHAFVAREGRHLRSSEIVGDTLHEGDELVVQPDIQAG